MTQNNRRLLLTAALALVVLMAGCASLVGDDNPDADNIDADELEEKALEAMEDVETFSMESHHSLDVMGSTSETSAEGVMDLENQQAQITLSIDEMGVDEEIEQYIIDETVYMGMSGEWVKLEIPEDDIWKESETAQQEETLEMGDLEIRDTTTFDGHDVYVVDVELDESDLESIIEGPDAGMDSSFEDGFGGDSAMDDFELSEVTVTQYIDVDTHHIRYVAMNFEMETPTGPAGMDLEMTFSEFNEDVSIELPSKAEDATTIDEWVMGAGLGLGESWDDWDEEWGDWDEFGY